MEPEEFSANCFFLDLFCHTALHAKLTWHSVKGNRKVSKNLILCSECRCDIDNADKALFVDQSSNRPFCSEKCIMDFHVPHMESFERQELSRREDVGADLDEGLAPMYQHHELFQKALYQPDEVWFEKNGVGEEFYTHISRVEKDGDNFTYIVICSYFNNEPSFVYFKCLTRNENLVNLYKEKSLRKPNSIRSYDIESDASEEVEESTQDEVQIPPEALEDLELKKSEYLASLLENRSDSDIAFEDFTKYDEYMSLTIEDADEVYAMVDEAGDKVRTYIKSFKNNDEAFYYVVVCITIALKELDGQEALLPVIGFPSTDHELYKNYAVGERSSDMIKN